MAKLAFLDQFGSLFLEHKYVNFPFPYCALSVHYVLKGLNIHFINENRCLHCLYFKLHLSSFNKLVQCSTLFVIGQFYKSNGCML